MLFCRSVGPVSKHHFAIVIFDRAFRFLCRGNGVVITFNRMIFSIVVIRFEPICFSRQFQDDNRNFRLIARSFDPNLRNPIPVSDRTFLCCENINVKSHASKYSERVLKRTGLCLCPV